MNWADLGQLVVMMLKSRLHFGISHDLLAGATVARAQDAKQIAWRPTCRTHLGSIFKTVERKLPSIPHCLFALRA